jgi:hypothetical protein
MQIFDDNASDREAGATAALPDGLITTSQAATLFHRTPRTLRNWRKRGWLQAVRIAGGLYFRKSDIETLLAGGEASGGTADNVPEPPASVMAAPDPMPCPASAREADDAP